VFALIFSIIILASVPLLAKMPLFTI
jgi:hypothetical protein